MPRELLPAFESVARDLLARVEAIYARPPCRAIRLHGDCHAGNLMHRDDVYHVVDLDDCRMGPAVQDLWMMLAGSREERLGQLKNDWGNWPNWWTATTSSMTSTRASWP